MGLKTIFYSSQLADNDGDVRPGRFEGERGTRMIYKHHGDKVAWERDSSLMKWHLLEKLPKLQRCEKFHNGQPDC